MSGYILGARSVVTVRPSVPPIPPTPSAGSAPVVRSPYPRRVIDLLGVNGDVIRLTDPAAGLKVLADPPPVGFWMPEFDRTTSRTPGVDGARYGDVNTSPRTTGLTVSYRLRDVPAVRAFTDRLAQALNPKRGLAGFLVTEADNTARMVTGEYEGGGRVEHLRTFGNVRINLDVADIPCWVDAPGSELPEQTWRAATAGTFYPYLPTVVAADSAVGEPVDVDNNGHEELFPDWLLRGPATGLLLANDTTGEQLRWTGVLAAGKWLAFVTQPGLQEVVDSDGIPRFDELDQDPDPAFWPLEAGVNTIRTVIDGIGVGSSVTLLPQQRRWLVQG